MRLRTLGIDRGEAIGTGDGSNSPDELAFANASDPDRGFVATGEFLADAVVDRDRAAATFVTRDKGPATTGAVVVLATAG